MNENNYGKELKRIVVRKRLYWASIVLFFPIGLFFSSIMVFDSTLYPPVFWAIAAALLGLHTITSKCPRCKKSFFGFGSKFAGFTKKCANCELPLKAE